MRQVAREGGVQGATAELQLQLGANEKAIQEVVIYGRIVLEDQLSS